MARIADTVERVASPGPELEPYRLPGKEYDHLGRQVPRNPHRGKAGVVWLLQLGMAAQFRAEVPASHVAHVLASGPAVVCRCGSVVELEVGEVAECPGGCDRWFLRTETSVRVARWAPAPDTEGDAGG